MKRYELNKDLAFERFRTTVDSSNELSRNLFKTLDLKENGHFFTFLPIEVDIQHIHDFTRGGMTRDSKDMTIQFLMGKLLSKQGYSLIFDDVLEDYQSLSGYDLFKTNGIRYKNEAYYLLNSKQHPSLSLIRECLRASDAEWHCLGILSLIDLDRLKTKTMTLEMIRHICINADLILTTAYDGEGYILWEKNEQAL
jgi:hypothetical protein